MVVENESCFGWLLDLAIVMMERQTSETRVSHRKNTEKEDAEMNKTFGNIRR